MKVLIVDDEPNIRNLLSKYFAIENIESEVADNGLSAQRKILEDTYDACILDLRMPGMDGISLIKWIRNEGFRMVIIMISAHGEISDAVEALKDGAQDYIVKPFDPDELILKIKNLVQLNHQKNIIEIENRKRKDDNLLIGETKKMVEIKEIINKVSSSKVNVLITGESGTGKEVVAKDIHKSSPVSNGPFVAINIGGIQENLLESELFGYEKGAFTGAVSRKIGMFELASGGTLFLDEIGDMPFSLQVKMLRVLQERKITRLGGTNLIPIDVRIISATNKDLEKAVEESRFREDLFYRLNVVRIKIPPLRERREDIVLLAQNILNRLNQEMGRHITGFTVEALELLKNYSFYGNVRELENVLERAIIFADSTVITPDCLELRSSKKHKLHAITGDFSNTVGKTLDEIEKESIINALHRWEGNRTRASEELGIARRTLINKIAEYNLDL
ncbi:MAG: sigma-54 dependent transcriptional regulator [Candidatus Paceibacterota bacterium]